MDLAITLRSDMWLHQLPLLLLLLHVAVLSKPGHSVLQTCCRLPKLRHSMAPHGARL